MQIIDSLLVTLGLDPKPYKKGKEDAEKSNKQLATGTKKAGAEMQAALGGVARQVGLLVLGFESIRGALSFLGEINSTDAALGRLAANTGQNVQELNLWGNAVNLAGGRAEDAQRDILNLSGSLTALRTTGEVSPLVLLMQRLGVEANDAEGQLKPMAQLLDEMGGKLRQFDRRTAFNIGTSAGLSEGTLNLLLLEDEARARIFAKAQAQNNLDAAAAERAQQMLEQWRELKQSAVEFGRVLNTAVFPAVMEFFNALKPIQPVMVDIVNTLRDMGAFTGAATAIKGIAEAVRMAVDGWKQLIDLMPAAQAAVTNALEAIANAAKSVGDAFSGAYSFMFSAPEGTGKDRPGAERSGTSMAAAAQARRQAAVAARQATTATPGGATNETNVQIDNITVHTAATDANGIASDMRAAIERKGIVNQADTGMN